MSRIDCSVSSCSCWASSSFSCCGLGLHPSGMLRGSPPPLLSLHTLPATTHCSQSHDIHDSASPPAMYLLLYNTVNSLLWARVFLSVLSTPLPALYASVEPLARWTQTLSVAEIVHAALGTYAVLLRYSGLHPYQQRSLISNFSHFNQESLAPPFLPLSPKSSLAASRSGS